MKHDIHFSSHCPALGGAVLFLCGWLGVFSIGFLPLRQMTAPPFTIRPAHPDDAEALSQLMCDNAWVTLAPHYTPVQMDTFLRYYSVEAVAAKIGSQAVFCAEENGQIIGTVALNGDFVVGFYTHRDYLGRGIGATLLRHIETFALSKGLSEIQLSASPVGLAFYYKHGFEKVSDCVFSYLGVDFDETLMRKVLIHPMQGES